MIVTKMSSVGYFQFLNIVSPRLKTIGGLKKKTNHYKQKIFYNIIILLTN